MRFGSVCSGIEAASSAWHPLGWEAAWLSEIEPFPRAVLSHHYPGIPLHGDFTLLRNDAAAVADIDVLVGGCPCQSFSLAGLRRSLDDDRGNLTLEFVRLINAIDDVRADRGEDGIVVVYENVPGILSTKDNAFGCFLAALVGADAPLVPGRKQRWTDAGMVAGPRRTAAWRVLDAQYFGLAQRRERVFVVASPRNGADPSAILFEPEGVRRYSPPSRETGESVTQALTRSLGAGGADDNRAQGGFYVPDVSTSLRARDGKGSPDSDCTSTLLAFGGNNTGGAIDVATALNAHGGPCGRMDFESETFVVGTLNANGKAAGSATQQDAECGMLVPVFGAETFVVPLRASGAENANGCGIGSNGDPSLTLDCDGSAGVAVCEPLPFDTTQITSAANRSNPRHGDPCHPLAAGAHPPAIAFSCKDHGADATVELAPTMRAMHHDGSHANAGGQLAVCVHGTQDPDVAVEYAHTLGRNQGQENAVCITGDTTHALTAEGFDASEDGTGRGCPVIAFQERGRDGGRVLDLQEDIAYALTSPKGGGRAQERNIFHTSGVRRLTPKEAERLQGFPDGYTDVPYRGKPAADGPRYRALGNSMAVPVMSWLGKRIDTILRKTCSSVNVVD